MLLQSQQPMIRPPSVGRNFSPLSTCVAGFWNGNHSFCLTNPTPKTCIGKGSTRLSPRRLHGLQRTSRFCSVHRLSWWCRCKNTIEVVAWKSATQWLNIFWCKVSGSMVSLVWFLFDWILRFIHFVFLYPLTCVMCMSCVVFVWKDLPSHASDNNSPADSKKTKKREPLRESPHISIFPPCSPDTSTWLVTATQCWQLLHSNDILQKDFKALLRTVPTSDWVSRFVIDLSAYNGTLDVAKGALRNDLTIPTQELYMRLLSDMVAQTIVDVSHFLI